jgi:hypothetical protein
MIFQVKELHLVAQWSSPAKRPREVRATVLSALLVLALCFTARAQVNSGSTGSDGALDYSAINYTTNIVIDMHDHPTGIYNYTYVSIPIPVTVTFIPNANNTPVTWLVQGDCTIAGSLSVSGSGTTETVVGAQGGPGGWRAGDAALSTVSLPGAGLGPGGGTVGTDTSFYGGNASFATMGDCNINTASGLYLQFPPGLVYGNTYELPLLGGSGGSGGRDIGGGGGGGAILIATSGTLTISGSILARGGSGVYSYTGTSWGNWYRVFVGTAGAGSGGAIRLVATTISGSGTLDTSGGQALFGDYNYSSNFDSGGLGRIRLDGLSITFNGPTTGMITSGFQPVIVPVQNQLASLLIASIAGVAVAANPSGMLVTPDAVIAGQQANPIPVVVNCSNLPLNTPVTVTVKPANGSPVSAVGYNTTGTLASSTATISINMPHGGGIIYATAATGN